MKLHRLAILAVLAALASACASVPKTASAPVAQEAVAGAHAPAAAATPATTDAANAATAPAADANAAPASDAAATAAEDDFAAIYGQGANADPSLPPQAQKPLAYDPWEKYNRGMHAFNNAVDKGVARPLARGYVKVVPQPVRTGISNFFDNLGSPLDMLNLFLQGRPKEAWDTLGRFLMNTTLGVGGLFDPASKARIPRHDADFGQTMAVWGWRRSRYFELPLFGPRTLRDAFGVIGDIPLSPSHYIQDDTVRYGLQGLQLVDTRAQLLPLDGMREGAADDYALVRDAWMQRRNYQIQKRVFDKKNRDDSLPDYLQQPGQQPDVPANAMPIPVTLPVPGGG
jgi:phospholipid-binding lipoprotein MlaA